MLDGQVWALHMIPVPKTEIFIWCICGNKLEHQNETKQKNKKTKHETKQNRKTTKQRTKSNVKQTKTSNQSKTEKMAKWRITKQQNKPHNYFSFHCFSIFFLFYIFSVLCTIVLYDEQIMHENQWSLFSHVKWAFLNLHLPYDVLCVCALISVCRYKKKKI